MKTLVVPVNFMEKSQVNGEILLVQRRDPVFIKPETTSCNGEAYLLSNLDLPVVSIMKTVYIYSNLDGNRSGSGCCDVMKQALAKTLVHYYPLAGRLSRSPSNGDLYVECSTNDSTNAGVPFVEAEADSEIGALGDITVPDTPMLEKLVYGVPGVEDILEMPLLTVQVTRFKCGGLAMGMALNHCMADGIAAMEFVNSWAETARGETLTMPPFLDRSVLRITPSTELDKNDDDPSQKPTIFNDVAISDISNMEAMYREEETIYKSFKFDQEKLAGLKKLALEHGTTGGTEQLITYCSSFTALAALVWRARSQALKMEPKQQSKLVFTVDIRSKFSRCPLVPKGYFGNGVLVAECVCEAGELREKPFSFAVKMVQDAIRRVDEGYVRAYIEGLDRVGAGPPSSNAATLVITSWRRIGFSGAADFGWGEPAQFGSVGIPREVGLFVSDGKGSNDDGIVLVLGLPASAMNTFKDVIIN